MSKVIAIDGPAGSGKGTVARILSEKLGYVNIDTGATYRCVALKMLKNGISLDEKEKIEEIASNIDIKLTPDGKVFLDNEDVTEEIRSKEVTEIVSLVSSNVKVREYMVDIQRKMAENSDVVMEGRDITTVVFPNADYKFYLDADPYVRTKRRVKENLEKGINMSFEEVYDNILKRDYNDMNKEVGALKRCDDQIYIDSTSMTINDVVNTILETIKKIDEENIKTL